MARTTPLFPLLVKKREVDKVVVLDSSGETSDFKPKGQSFLATKQKVSMLPRGFMNFSSPFPNSTDEFVSLGLNTRPVFFVCADADDAEDQYPLLVHIPNDDPGNVTNIVTSTLQLRVVNQTRIFDRSYLLASRGRVVNATDDDLGDFNEQWGTCVACATVERARARQGVRRTAACEQCFTRYCFTEDQSTSNDSGWRVVVPPSVVAMVSRSLGGR
ncbi:hypothetical protein L227DRAFT_579193 [Lentinus tigrinus ALCF2SS1-6]|uniref:Lysophospholipase n=1 Tax=Lentinus tigrinus ALCF2SS1-6 TaxID=1328759 RepID=A0A5C2RY27_9APHY|nr:hypothetical protein L227DRAFT_579193 [Lentinus tigrinus ALCF2SS1-6]